MHVSVDDWPFFARDDTCFYPNPALTGCSSPSFPERTLSVLHLPHCVRCGTSDVRLHESPRHLSLATISDPVESFSSDAFLRLALSLSSGAFSLYSNYQITKFPNYPYIRPALFPHYQHTQLPQVTMATPADAAASQLSPEQQASLEQIVAITNQTQAEAAALLRRSNWSVPVRCSCPASRRRCHAFC